MDQIFCLGSFDEPAHAAGGVEAENDFNFGAFRFGGFVFEHTAIGKLSKHDDNRNSENVWPAAADGLADHDWTP